MLEPEIEVICFTTGEAAKAYRAAKGCGGWVFLANNGKGFLFHVRITAEQAFNHPALIGSDGTFY